MSISFPSFVDRFYEIIFDNEIWLVLFDQMAERSSPNPENLFRAFISPTPPSTTLDRSSVRMGPQMYT